MVTKIDYDKYLASKTAALIRENFSERGITNILIVRWSNKKSKRILGHIKPVNDTEFGSIIEINPLLKDLSVPEYVLDYVLMHELTHYFQGFGSNHKRKHKHPHRGGIVEKELARHGWEEITQKSEKWIKENWKNLVAKKIN
ncbi:MAG: hypothetical protein ACOX1V_03625 [Candidatus Iainarchaeum sp.]|jgi:hypothetical protein|nr:MAG: hypothetical protein BWY55_00797 [archaeon ADurb.Bin336]